MQAPRFLCRRHTRHLAPQWSTEARVRFVGMVSVDEAARIAMELPEVTEGASYGNRTWFVGGQGVRVGAAVQQGRHQAVR